MYTFLVILLLSLGAAQLCYVGNSLPVGGTGSYGALCNGSTTCWPFEVEGVPFPPTYSLRLAEFGLQTQSVVRIEIYPPLPSGVEICDVGSLPPTLLTSDVGVINFVPPPTPGTFYACARQLTALSSAVAVRIGACTDPLPFPTCNVQLPSEDGYPGYDHCDVRFQTSDDDSSGGDDDNGGGASAGVIAAAVIIPIVFLVCFPCIFIVFCVVCLIVIILLIICFIALSSIPIVILVVIVVVGLVLAILPIICIVILVAALSFVLYKAFCSSRQTVQVVTHNANSSSASPFVNQTHNARNATSHTTAAYPPPPNHAPAPSYNSSSKGTRVRVRTGYLGGGDGELTVGEGDVVTRIEERGDGWSLCETDGGGSGWVPSHVLIVC